MSPAFPILQRDGNGNLLVYEDVGMTLRDYFAAKAMQAIVTALAEGIRPADIVKLAGDAYAIADDMLKARKS